MRGPVSGGEALNHNQLETSDFMSEPHGHPSAHWLSAS